MKLDDGTDRRPEGSICEFSLRIETERSLPVTNRAGSSVRIGLGTCASIGGDDQAEAPPTDSSEGDRREKQYTGRTSEVVR